MIGLTMARSGASWRRLPVAYGKWKSVYYRFAHGCDRGVGPRLMAYLRDSTVGRAHVSAAGAPKKGTKSRLGRNRGGFSTQIHILADQRGRPLCLHLMGGQRHDRT